VESGLYEFDGYVETAIEPAPNPEQTIVPLGIGDVFPEIEEPSAACFWRLAEGERATRIAGPAQVA
jgi:hypothetical protein